MKILKIFYYAYIQLIYLHVYIDTKLNFYIKKSVDQTTGNISFPLIN